MFDVSYDQRENFNFLIVVIGFILYTLTNNIIISFLILIILQICICLYTYCYSVNKHNLFIKNLGLVSLEMVVMTMIINSMILSKFGNRYYIVNYYHIWNNNGNGLLYTL